MLDLNMVGTGSTNSFKFGQNQSLYTFISIYGEIRISLTKWPIELTKTDCDRLRHREFVEANFSISCINCLMKSDFETNNSICTSPGNIQFYDYSIRIDETRSNDFNQKRVWAILEIIDFNNSIFDATSFQPTNILTKIQGMFNASVPSDPSNTVTLSMQEYVPNVPGKFKVEVVLSKELFFNTPSQPESILFQKNFNNLVDYNSSGVQKVANVVEYTSPEHKMIQIDKCDFFKENAKMIDLAGVKKFGCVSCEYDYEFNNNSQDCQSGSILRFYDWSVEELASTDSLDVNGNILFNFKILGVNIPLYDPEMPDQIIAFIETSLAAQFEDSSLAANVNLTITYDTIEGEFLTDTANAPQDITYRVKL